MMFMGLGWSYTADLVDRHHITKGGTLAGVGVLEEEGAPRGEIGEKVMQ